MNSFSAKEPALGYLYQIQYGLFLLINSKSEENPKVLIETLDDIEIIGNKSSLYQTKYHLKKEVNLTDRSTDFWKTIRVWSEQITDNVIDENTIFSLITTESVLAGTLIDDIKKNEDIDSTLKKMRAIAHETKNKSNKKGYDAFLALTDNEQNNLIKNISIIDTSMDFEDIEEKIKNELKLSTLPQKIDAMFDRVEGWFLNNCILHLQSKKDYISFNELQQYINYVADSFKEDNLPNDFPDKIFPDNEDIKTYNSMDFIKQLDIVDISKRMKERAISDYYRAYSQRSKCLKDDLLNPQEEIDFDKRLTEDWSRKFDLLLDKTDKASISMKIEEGKLFYEKHYIESCPNVFIRNRFQEDYLTLGSCHMLSNKHDIGWHPDYIDLIKEENDS